MYASAQSARSSWRFHLGCRLRADGYSWQRLDAYTVAPVLTYAARPAPHSMLNAAQLAAVQHGAADGGLAGPLLVIAGAGTGKTFTKASRVARLILDGADPQRILMMTFSRRAAAAMSHRVGRLLHDSLHLGATTAPPSMPWSGTFHSVGVEKFFQLIVEGLAPGEIALQQRRQRGASVEHAAVDGQAGGG